MLAVPETDAVIYPGAMMVHVEDAAVARRAVMTALGFEHVTHEAVTASLVFVVSQVEAPEYGDLPRISCHRLEKRPQ